MANERLLLFSSFTAQPIRKPLSAWSAQLGLTMPIAFVPGDRPFQHLLDASGEVIANVGINVALIRAEDVIPASNLADLDKAQALDERMSQFIEAIHTYALHSSAPLLVLLCPPSRNCSRPYRCNNSRA